ncbi:MAG: hypothetical protein R2771_00690 [Saprospiraceae bacterium]
MTFEVELLAFPVLNPGGSNSYTVKEGTVNLGNFNYNTEKNKITLPADGLQHTLVFADVELNSARFNMWLRKRAALMNAL